MHVKWFHANGSQTFILVLQPILHMELVLWLLGEKSGPLEEMNIGIPQESIQQHLVLYLLVSQTQIWFFRL